MSYMPMHEWTKPIEMNTDISLGTGTTNGTAIDTDNFDEALIIVKSGQNGTSGTVDIKIQESDVSGSGFADITGAAFAQIVEANDNTVYHGRLSLIGRKRYIRAVIVVGTAACDVAVLCQLGCPIKMPVTQVQTISFNLDPT